MKGQTEAGRRRPEGSRNALALAAFCALSACVTRVATTSTVTELPAGTEAVSLFNEPLFPAPLAPAVRERMTAQLVAARAALAASPASADALIWVGRRTAYLGRFQEAIAIFSDGTERFPADARMFRHRGHRYISVRNFPGAVADLDSARGLTRGKPDDVEPDGQPNARNIPTSTLQGNIRYHLGLAHYLRGEFAKAIPVYQEDLAAAPNADTRVATTHWLYMALQRAGRRVDAERALMPISAQMDVVENGAYHRLLLLYKGLVPPDSILPAVPDTSRALDEATLGYGLGNWHFYHGRRAAAIAAWRRVLAVGPWASFGYIAAEADLARLGEKPR
jgi:tetratricopeptide (TPR) repeat protein